MSGFNYQTPTRISPIGAYNPARRLQQPAPFQPPAPPAAYQPPMQYPQYPGYPQYPQPNGYGAGGFFKDVFTGLKDRGHEIGQFVLHPLDASKRTTPFRNPYAPRRTGETVGRWIVNGALIVGAVLLGKGLLGRFAGGGAGVGSSFSFGDMFYKAGAAIGDTARFAGKIVAAPFKLGGKVLGAVWSGISNVAGSVAGLVSGGGARVGWG